MKKRTQYWISCVLLVCCATVVSTQAAVGMKRLLEVISHRHQPVDDPSAHPFDERPSLSHWKRIVHVQSSDHTPMASAMLGSIRSLDRTQTVTLPILFTMITSHFRFIPFWPRDPLITSFR